MKRIVKLERKTNETEVMVALNLDGTGEYQIDTGIPFFDHMLAQLARHGGIDLTIQAQGDLEVDFHHTVEDVGILLGRSWRQAVGEARGIQRFGQALTPMDDSLSRVAVDLSGRAYLYSDLPFATDRVGNFATELVQEFLQALVFNAGMTLHVELLHGRNTHHQVEAVFKGLGRSIKMAIQIDPDLNQVPSTKGVL